MLHPGRRHGPGSPALTTPRPHFPRSTSPVMSSSSRAWEHSPPSAPRLPSTISASLTGMRASSSSSGLRAEDAWGRQPSVTRLLPPRCPCLLARLRSSSVLLRTIVRKCANARKQLVHSPTRAGRLVRSHPLRAQARLKPTRGAPARRGCSAAQRVGPIGRSSTTGGRACGHDPPAEQSSLPSEQAAERPARVAAVRTVPSTCARVLRRGEAQRACGETGCRVNSRRRGSRPAPSRARHQWRSRSRRSRRPRRRPRRAHGPARGRRPRRSPTCGTRRRGGGL